MKRSSNYLFFLNFLKNPLRNASVVPSSKMSSRAMVRGIDFSKVRTIIELGPGEGSFTKHIIKKALPDAKIILIEIEESYVTLLQKRFKDRVIVEHASAAKLDFILKKHRIGHADVIISGLPFTLMHKEKRLMRTIKKQTDNGTIFRFFTYMPPIMKKVYHPLRVEKKSFVWKNLPPLWVYGIK